MTAQTKSSVTVHSILSQLAHRPGLCLALANYRSMRSPGGEHHHQQIQWVYQALNYGEMHLADELNDEFDARCTAEEKAADKAREQAEREKAVLSAETLTRHRQKLAAMNKCTHTTVDFGDGPKIAQVVVFEVGHGHQIKSVAESHGKRRASDGELREALDLRAEYLSGLGGCDA
jgi:hypothetical protein